MKKIAILGSAGSGKSTLAKILGEKLHVDVLHLDTLFWKPGWKASTIHELKNKQKKFLNKEAWIIDGNYSRVWDERLDQADTIIFLNLPRTLCLLRILNRWRRYRGKIREDLGAGCPEKMDLEFIKYVWNFPEQKSGKILKAMMQRTDKAQLLVFNNRKSIQKFTQQPFSSN
ncbi:hypothetical protein MUN89_12600 [Halobacillus salinarum]|uniref:Topology modulation protein n=1 Tax=Halobacillus salinarum TaxID=2932257 RepID=A0ABY4EEB0_9BACI|nr:hypothetical protein [Halobacillus salinarum]UOQ42804.1 hypothetical protein MUN89_12600 [Halobacillus salinarum]